MSVSFPPPKQFAHIESGNTRLGPVDEACRLLGPTALIVQGLMGVLVVMSLVYKRYREKPMRPWRIWLFDVSKQILGQAFVHGLNILISDIIARVAKGNPCDLYFLNILVDTTLGVGYIYLVLHFTDKLLTGRLKLKGFKSGQYGDPPSLKYWAKQASVYVFTILTMKLLVVGLFAAWPGIFDIAEYLLSWTSGHERIQVIFVMGLFPIFMNILQFWLIDSIVKASNAITPEQLNTADEASREPLFHDAGSDTDEDIDQIRANRRHDIESPPTPQKAPHKVSNGSEDKSISTSNIVESSSVQRHNYPPERTRSSGSLRAGTASPLTPSSSSSISSLRSKKSSKRRSPPPPILRPPPHNVIGTEYTISTTPSPMVSLHRPNLPSPSPPKARQRHKSKSSLARDAAAGKTEADAWTTWAEDEDWASKVGEEEWTGRRVGATKNELDAWSSQGPVEVS